jgi:3-methylfumaryl-CoA hydratase
MSEGEAASWQDWIGREQRQSATLEAGLAARLAALFDRPAPAPGAELPALWHWACFAALTPQAELGTDGHAARGSFLPPIDLPRRMWAGSRLHFHAPLTVGAAATRTTRIAAIARKQGAQGPLAFVTLIHETRIADRLCLSEEQDIVYRGPARTDATPPAAHPAAASAPADWRAPQLFDPALLFRYSAATFNAHRIHYDADYARTVEHYPGLVVHGPLLATLLAGSVVAQSQQRLRSFVFRATAPLIAGPDPAQLCGTAEADAPGCFTLWVESGAGDVTMRASATTETADGHA